MIYCGESMANSIFRYRRCGQFDFEALYGNMSDEGKGWKCLSIAERLEDSGESMEAVGWYKKAFKLCPALERY